MKVLYIHQYFKTPQDGGSLRSYYLAKELVKNGHQVIMITAHDASTHIEKSIEGIDIIYLPVVYANQMSLTRRSVSFLRFMLLAIFESTKQKSIDICYVMTTPLSTGVIALFNKFFLRRKYIFEVGDLWPKVPIEMGLIKERWSRKLLEWAEVRFYKNAHGLVGLSEPMTAHLSRLAPKVPTETVFNISHCERFSRSKKNDRWVKKFGIENGLVISYTGTFGIANDLSRVIDLAESVQDLPIQFLAVGDGAEKQKIRGLIQSKGLKNIKIYNFMTKNEIEEVVNITDAMIISFADVESLHTGSPNKLFDALAAGKLVISNFRGWIGDLIESNSCGFVAQSAPVFRKKISELLKEPSILNDCQRNSRKLAEEKFDLGIQATRQLNFIKRTIS